MIVAVYDGGNDLSLVILVCSLAPALTRYVLLSAPARFEERVIFLAFTSCVPELKSVGGYDIRVLVFLLLKHRVIGLFSCGIHLLAKAHGLLHSGAVAQVGGILAVDVRGHLLVRDSL